MQKKHRRGRLSRPPTSFLSIHQKKVQLANVATVTEDSVMGGFELPGWMHAPLIQRAEAPSAL
jgi:hypothetical protein